MLLRVRGRKGGARRGERGNRGPAIVCRLRGGIRRGGSLSRECPPTGTVASVFRTGTPVAGNVISSLLGLGCARLHVSGEGSIVDMAGSSLLLLLDLVGCPWGDYRWIVSKPTVIRSYSITAWRG